MRSDSAPKGVEMLHNNFYAAEDVFATTSEQARGLMFRDDFPNGGCVLFPYLEPKRLSFHGRNCRFPIIVAFFRPDGCLDSWGILEPDGAPVSSVGECVLAVEWKATEGNVDAVSRSVRAYLCEGGIVLA